MSSSVVQAPEASRSCAVLNESKLLRLQLFPLTIAAIVAMTMIPLRVRWPSLVYLDLSTSREDIFNNILLSMPLGWSLGARSLWRCLGISFGVSLFAEVLQFGYVDRDPSPIDVAANTFGALAGFI